MHMHATFDQNIPCGARVMSILTKWTWEGQTDWLTVIIVQTQGSCNKLSKLLKERALFIWLVMRNAFFFHKIYN